MLVDLLVYPQWIIPVEPHNQVLTNHALAIKDQRIVAIVDFETADTQYRTREKIHLPGQVVLPGFVNSHTHTPLNLLRGFANDRPLLPSSQKHIWPKEQQWLSKDFVRAGTSLAIAEMLRGGTTCFNDMYYYPEVIAKAVETIGIRAAIGGTITDFSTSWASNPEQAIAKTVNVHQQYKQHPLIEVYLAPHSCYAVDETILKSISDHADKFAMLVQMHVQETQDEVDQHAHQHGIRPLQKLRDLGLLSPRFQAVHMTHIDDYDIEILSHTRTNVAHCLESNMQLASGICPVIKMQKAGVNVALGTGSVANNSLNMLGEMRQVALLHKCINNDAEILSAAEVLRMATLNGAKALGIDNEIGSLEPGKAADFISIDLDSIETQPVYNPLAQVVYAASRNQVKNVWVAGQQLLAGGKLTTIDKAKVLNDTKEWQEKIAK